MRRFVANGRTHRVHHGVFSDLSLANSVESEMAAMGTINHVRDVRLGDWLAMILVCVACGIAFPVQSQNTQEQPPLEQLTLSQLEERIQAGDLGKIRALATSQYGETINRKRFGKGEMGKSVDIKSAGKSITALAVGAAIADGSLPGTDTKVWPYLGSSRGAPFDEITVADLLSMSSALDCNDWERKSPGQEEKMYRRREWRKFALELPARNFVRDEKGRGAFSYCTAGVFLLGQVVEKATGEQFDTYVQRRLFDPLGIDGVVWRTSRSGEIQSGGQLTIGDDALLKIGQLVLNRGQWERQEVIPETWIRSMLTSRHKLGEHVHYGYLWWMMPVQSSRGFEAAFMMKGNGGNIVAIVPAMDAVLVVQTESYNKRDADRHSFTALTAMLKSLPVPQE
ncbi:MAG: serine hydrolase [Pseudomonadota bacterium]